MPQAWEEAGLSFWISGVTCSMLWVRTADEGPSKAWAQGQPALLSPGPPPWKDPPPRPWGR